MPSIKFRSMLLYFLKGEWYGTVLLVLFCLFNQLIDISLKFSVQTTHWFGIILYHKVFQFFIL
jgi:hypothetical protein